MRVIVIALLASCSSDPATGPGTLHETCLPNGGCDPGLICAGGTCESSAIDAAVHDGVASTDAPSTGADAAHVACVTHTNMYRAQKSKAAVAESAALETYADVGAMHDFSTSPHDHFSTTNGGGIAFAENECPQQGNWNLSFGNGDLTMTVLACVDAFFQEGPGGGHYENMMGPYAKLGCGIFVQGQKLTIVQDYGN